MPLLKLFQVLSLTALSSRKKALTWKILLLSFLLPWCSWLVQPHFGWTEMNQTRNLKQ